MISNKMLRSMTAYGRASIEHRLGRFVVEIYSVNKKFFEVTYYGPVELSRFDMDIRKWVNAEVSRGYVTVRVSADFEESSPVVVKPNISLAKQLKAAWKRIAEEVGCDGRVDLALLAQEENLICHSDELRDEEAYRQLLQRCVSEALQQLIAMKDKEGCALIEDIEGRLSFLHQGIEAIASRAKGAPNRYRQKLEATLQEVLSGGFEDEERLLREVCIYADRVDVSEEITRFRAHLEHFESLLRGEEVRIGKKLDFILQELNREINTIGSKVADVEIARLVVEIKNELERIREQIQNVE